MVFLSHSHEEADTQIPLHILFSIEYNALVRLALNFDVHTVDSDILLLLDLVYHYPETIKPSISIILHKGLPRTRGALVPELQRINHMGYIHRSCNVTHPNPSPVIESGWQRNEDGAITTVYCLIPLGPKDCLNSVLCGCTTGCSKTKWCKCYQLQEWKTLHKCV